MTGEERLIVCGRCIGSGEKTWRGHAPGTFITDKHADEMYCWDCGESTALRPAKRTEKKGVVNERTHPSENQPQVEVDLDHEEEGSKA